MVLVSPGPGPSAAAFTCLPCAGFTPTDVTPDWASAPPAVLTQLEQGNVLTLDTVCYSAAQLLNV